MLLVVIAIVAVIFFAGVYAAVMRGGLGLVKKRLEEEPELASSADEDELDDGHLPTDIEY